MVVDIYPLVSIITPVYNGSEYLENLIQSVLNQTYPNIEHIIIDDGSQDNEATVSILRKHSRLRWWSQSNKGQYATMNDGLSAARGQIICFVNADDLVSPDAVKTAVQSIRDDPLLDGLFGITNYIDQNGNDCVYWLPFRMASISFYPYFGHISHCSLYIKKESIQQHGLSFNPSLRFVGDYEWIIRIHKARLRIGMIRRELSKVRIHTDQASQKNRNASTLEARRVLNALHINTVNYFLLSTINIFLIRAWKIGWMMKSLGVRGTVIFLMKKMSQA